MQYSDFVTSIQKCSLISEQLKNELIEKGKSLSDEELQAIKENIERAENEDKHILQKGITDLEDLIRKTKRESLQKREEDEASSESLPTL